VSPKSGLDNFAVEENLLPLPQFLSHRAYLGVKVFNALPSDIKTEFNNPKKFKVVLQKFLYEKSFYSLDEYFDLQNC